MVIPGVGPVAIRSEVTGMDVVPPLANRAMALDVDEDSDERHHSQDMGNEDQNQQKLRLELQQLRQRIEHERREALRDEGTEAAINKEEEDLTRYPEPRDRYGYVLSAVNSDPFACLCRCNLPRIGQSYVLRDEGLRGDRALLLVGPHWIGVVVTTSIILSATAMFLHQQCRRLAWQYTATALLFCGLTLFYLFRVACTDPGIVFPSPPPEEMPPLKQRSRPRKSHPSRERTNASSSSSENDADDDEAVEEGSIEVTARLTTSGSGSDRALAEMEAAPSGHRRHSSSSSSSSRSSSSRRSRAAARPRFCDICGVDQARFTEHCEDCGVCIAGYDHHCPWMGKCIGQRNLRAFQLFNVSWVLYVVFVLGVSIQTADWSDLTVQRLHRLSSGKWVPDTPTHAPLPTVAAVTQPPVL